MKKILFLVIALCCTELFAQSNINGVYIEQQNKLNRIDLSNGQFKFIKQDAFHSYIELVVATANYKWIDEEFIEFYSENPKNMVDSTLKINKIDDKISGSNHNKKIKIVRPEIYTRTLKITLFYNVWNARYFWGLRYDKPNDNWKTKIELLSKRQVEFTVPARTRRIYVRIEPVNVYDKSIAGDNDMLYNSYLFYETPIIKLSDVNYVEINIVSIDDDYFGRYDINGEYAKVDGDKIVWRGKIFEKIPN